MPNTTFAGHPLHPQLISFPLGLLPFSLVLDVMHSVTGKRSYADAAYYTMVGGSIGAVAAGAAGAMDYLAIPPKSQSKKTADVHAVINLGVMGLYGLNLLLRRGKDRPGALPMLLSALGSAGLVASAWYGGKLVYELGMRVKPMMEGDDTPELKLPGDDRIHEAFESGEEAWTAAVGGDKQEK